MTRTTIQEITLTTLLASLACGALLAEQIAPVGSSEMVPYDDVGTPDAAEIIFSNLDSSRNNRYNSDYSDPFHLYSVAGRSASGGQTEQWVAVRFTPDSDVQAKVLMAAIGYISGDKLVNLGIYTNDDITGSVGTLLPGGQGATRMIPDVGECCQLAKVTLPGEGVTLTGGTFYWLVASPDNVRGPTFSGRWQLSNLARYASLGPPFPWNNYPAAWVAAEIRGTRVHALGPEKTATSKPPISALSAPNANITIFTNLGLTSTDRYLASAGLMVTGNNVPFQPEVWQALPFTPKVDVHAKTLTAAIGYKSGTKLVKLGIYSDSGGVPGTPLPGGQGSTRDIPDFDECCELAKVRLPGPGVALTAGGQYWLVASPDNARASDFWGSWRISSLAVDAYQAPEMSISWTNFGGNWLAAEIRGTVP